MTGDDRAPRSAVVVNPAKVTDLDELRRTVDDALAAAGWPEPEWYETTAEDPGRGQATQAVEAGAELVFACGGDGTVMACVTALAGTDVALAVLPAGTGNLLAANLGLSTDLAAGVEVAVERRPPPASTSASVEDQYFAVMAGMGFDAQMLDATSETTKKRHRLARVRGGGGQAPAGPADAGPHPHRRPAADAPPGPHRAGRQRRAGSRAGCACSPTPSRTTAGSTSPCSPRSTLRHWLRLGWAVVRRQERRAADGDVHRARRVEITSNRAQPRQLDGDLIAPGRHADRGDPPRALWLCVPQPGADPDLAVRRRRGRASAARSWSRKPAVSSTKLVPETRMMADDELSADDAWRTLRRHGGWHAAARRVHPVPLRRRVQPLPGLRPATLPRRGPVPDRAHRPDHRPGRRGGRPGRRRHRAGADPRAQRARWCSDLLGEGDRTEDAGELALALGLLTGLVALTTTMAQIERGANRIYGVERDRPALWKYLRAAVLAVAAGLPALAGFLILVGGGAMGDSVQRTLRVGRPRRRHLGRGALAAEPRR